MSVNHNPKRDLRPDDLLACSECLARYRDGKPTCKCFETWRANAIAVMVFMIGCIVTVAIAAVVALLKAR